jgi:hypothetical protein
MQTSTYRAIRHATMIVVALLACSGCVTAPNSNLSLNFNFFGSFSRIVEAIGGTNSKPTGASEGGGALTATVPMTP